MSELPDVQNRVDTRGIAIDRVGVTGIIFPTKVRVKRNKMDESALTLTQETPAIVDLYVGLPHEFKGVNMSRFMECLLAFHEKGAGFISCATLPDLLTRLQTEMDSEDAYVRMEFDYFITKFSPVTQIPAPQAYRCAFSGIMKQNEYEFILEVNTTAASLCPCSREMSLLENLNYKDIKWNLSPDPHDAYTAITKKIFDDASHVEMSQQVGMGAHNQRSLIRVQLTAKENQTIWIEDVIEASENAASAPTYPLLKRPDEKFVTEMAYQNAKFSEDIMRDLQTGISALEGIDQWSLKVENQESIHPYSVTCYLKSPLWKH